MYRTFLLLFIICHTVIASDHADPPLNNMTRDDIKLTGLLSFIDKEQLVVIIGSHPKLVAETGYQFPTDVNFNLYFDFTSLVNFKDQQNNQLYGGTIVSPERIKHDLSISLKFQKKQKLSDKHSFTTEIGGSNHILADAFKIAALVRDDPFTFPSFHGQNIAAIVISVPLSVLPIQSDKTVLMWSTITEQAQTGENKILEHVGRALRSQIKDRQILNMYPPAEQAAKTGLVTDVMIYKIDQPALLPNGRALVDDTLSILSDAGDQEVCKLFDKAKMDPTYTGKNDKPFLPQFPYLAAPHQ